MKLLLKHKVLKFALDFSLFQNEKRLYDEKKARGDGGKRTRGQEKDITEVKSGRHKSNNEEGRETRRGNIPGKEKGRECQMQNMSILRKLKHKTGKKEERSNKVKKRCWCHHLFSFRKVCLSLFHCLRMAAIMTLPKST